MTAERMDADANDPYVLIDAHRVILRAGAEQRVGTRT